MPEVTPRARSARWRTFLPAAFVALAGVCVFAFHDIAALYGNFELHYWGLSHVEGRELSIFVWYLFFGVPAIVLLAAAIAKTPLPDSVEATLRDAFAHRVFFLAGACILLFAAIAYVKRFVILGAQVADDEATYRFIAQTLVRGRLTNPMPEDPTFFANQFLIFNEAGWFGKYPIGHPALLALGEAVGARTFIPSLVSCASLVLAYGIGKHLFGALEANIGVCLLVLSPHFVFTAATELSQSSSTFFLLLGMWAVLEIFTRDRWWIAFLAGFAWGAGALVRPMPGVPFLVVALVVVLVRGPWTAGRKLKLLLVAAIPVALFGVVFLLVNKAQMGASLTSGYQAFHGQAPRPTVQSGLISASVGGALVRQNVWLSGWPLSLVFVVLCRLKRGALLFWGMIVAEYSYRVLIPKTVVSTTGPIYVTEIVPLLALATASGMLHVKDLLAKLEVRHAKRWIIGIGVAATAVAASTFFVVQIKNIRRSSALWNVCYRMLEQRGAEHALVFANTMIGRGDASWSYYPPNPSPTLDDKVLFVRMPKGAAKVATAKEFWLRRFPKREPFVFYYEPKTRKPVLMSLR